MQDAQAQVVPAALSIWSRAQFGWNDVLRRAQGDAFQAWGLGPNECPYRIVAAGPHWRLRAYADHERPRAGTDGAASAALLIVAAPIKRPYIWDLAPSVSVVRYALWQRLQVGLLEWLPASGHGASNGLDEYMAAIDECVATMSGDAPGGKPFLIGHSLGGTLAAIFAAAAPERLRGLVLLGAPLCFLPDTSQFRDALVSLVPSMLSEADPFPGSLLSHMSAMASPDTFIWSRFMDAALSIADHHALDIHARVERWALDEVPLPGKLVHQIVEWLYRENRFYRGALQVRGKSVGPASLSVPTVAVVNTADEVAPPASIKPFVDAAPAGGARMIEYAGESGTCLQHLAILVGRRAQAQVWPQIIAWLDAHPPPGRIS